MERIFWVCNGDLDEVNSYLEQGGKVKSVHAVSEGIAAYGYAGDVYSEDKGKFLGDIYAYIVVEL